MREVDARLWTDIPSHGHVNASLASARSATGRGEGRAALVGYQEEKVSSQPREPLGLAGQTATGDY